MVLSLRSSVSFLMQKLIFLLLIYLLRLLVSMYCEMMEPIVVF